jgi:hypothetical protein
MRRILMGAKYTNNTAISLSMAVWLAADLYDHNDDPNHISVTALIKPLKQSILSARVPPGTALPDLSGKIKAQSGTAVHTAVEVAWLEHYQTAMLSLGYPQKIIDRIRINPTSAELQEYYDNDVEIIPIYMELRSTKTIAGMNVSGKFDFVAEGNLEDIKNTSTYTYVKKSKDEDYKLQGSIYRWLNQDIITGDYITIQYVFSDWNVGSLKQNPTTYPPHACMPYKIPLMSISETEVYVENRINTLNRLWDAEESLIPECSPKELWRDDPVWKYYKNPAKVAGRSTKNFTNPIEANGRLTADGSVGVVKEVPGQVKACRYCDAFSICKQKDNYLANGSLKV